MTNHKITEKILKETLNVVGKRFYREHHTDMIISNIKKVLIKKAIELSFREKNTEIKKAIDEFIKTKREEMYDADNDELRYADKGKDWCLNDLEEFIKQKLGLK